VALAMGHFSTSVRVILCERCGAPLQVSRSAGPIPCGYCGASSLVERPPAESLGWVPPPAPAVDEAERLRRLCAQEGSIIFVQPTTLAHILPGGKVEPWRRDEVLHVYQATRQELRSTKSPDAAERLFHLSLALADHFATEGDLQRVRAVLETTLDTLALPRHRHVLAGFLARHAVREGDLEAAEHWLTACDKRSEDLLVDSSYRVSRATIDTARGNMRDVLAVLGSSGGTVPIARIFGDMATALRANAREKLGDVDGAVAELRAQFAQRSDAEEKIATFAARLPTLRLCEASLPRARHAQQDAAVRRATTYPKALGAFFVILGALILMSGALMSLLVTGVEQLSVMDEEAVWHFVRGALPFGLVGAAFCGAGIFLVYRGFKTARFLRHGVRAVGVVVGVEPAGSANRVPQAFVRVRIERADRSPYEVRLGPMAAVFSTGQRIPLRVSPTDPSACEVDVS
jgi:hypothetical protein